jgi:hypothetical protein
MHWPSGYPAIRSVDEGRILPKAPFTTPMPLVQPPREKGVDPQTVRDLALLLLKATRGLPDDDAFRVGVHDYLRRKGLEPSPLRDADVDEGRS